MGSRSYSREEHLYFLEWKAQWESENEESLIRSDFDPSDDLVSQCASWIANLHGVSYSNKEIRELSISVERAQLWKCLPAEVEETRAQANKNMREWGTNGGLPAVDMRNRGAVLKDRRAKQHSKEYAKYITGPVWAKRSLRYLQENCQVAGGYKCETCGRESWDRSTFNVHHNDYRILHGEEPDQNLCGVCADRCHELADLSRYARFGKICYRWLNDLLGLFRREVQC